MTDAYISDPIRHPLHTLISWPAVIAGAIVAVAVGAMLNLLGVALGASAFNPYDFDGGDSSGFTAAAGMWMAFANAIALFVGGAVASRAAKYADHHKGALHGLAVWALAFLLAITIASAAGAGGAAALVGGDARDGEIGDTVVTDVTPGSRVIEGELVAPAPLPAPVAAEEVADTTAMLALWGFLTMLIGAIAAIFGGLYGGRNHRWIDRAVDGRHDDVRRDESPRSVL
ncbi:MULTISPECIES: hypothetical protein [unclassified Brevundimonas]|uniref:hypothetical protein n=1 Tax=unclassified Brevundimonas TaxID=2622653 RepID=UPI0006FE5EC4|nr:MULTISPECIES: hypothetical protein [unclassified Brevundimonas]KQY90806.1 hypothetical protein ASD25_20005 [Brevundimonas sp. Root1423]KRA28487.1 hypothetical protein ASD59_01260 [Brevundimonas sp. Root608]